MIPSTLRFTLCVAVICYFIIILYYLKKRMLDLKYTLLWLVAGFVMGIMVFFPELLVRFVKIMGIESNMNGLYVLMLAFILMILMALTSIASRQTLRIKILVQEISMMEKRIRDLEDKAANLKDQASPGISLPCQMRAEETQQQKGRLDNEQQV